MSILSDSGQWPCISTQEMENALTYSSVCERQLEAK